MRYTNEDFITGNNLYRDIVSNGIVLDLTDFTSEKEIYSFNVYYKRNDLAGAPIQLMDNDVFLLMQHVDRAEFDEEYAIYINFQEKMLHIRYYEVGYREFNEFEFLMTKFKVPESIFQNPDILKNEVIVQFYSFNGNIVSEYRKIVLNFWISSE